jgi:hypothetical protein
MAVTGATPVDPGFERRQVLILGAPVLFLLRPALPRPQPLALLVPTGREDRMGRHPAFAIIGLEQVPA